jgi:hypothetical protein
MSTNNMSTQTSKGDTCNTKQIDCCLQCAGADTNLFALRGYFCFFTRGDMNE